MAHQTSGLRWIWRQCNTPIRYTYVTVAKRYPVPWRSISRQGSGIPGRSVPALFATDRTDRKTYIARGWKVTDPQAASSTPRFAWRHATPTTSPTKTSRYGSSSRTSRTTYPGYRAPLTMIREAVSEGRRFARVRIVSVPLTDYSRFGVWCSQFTNGAGEDIR